MFSRTIKRTLLQRIPHARYSSSGSPPPPPRGSFFSASAIYPFILLSAITSLALNLSHQRTARSQETSHLSAQITVLESLVNQLRNDPNRLSDEEVEKELELVGLGRGKGKRVVGGEGDKSGRNETSWGEVLFGKRGKEFEPDKDDTDWEKGMTLFLSLSPVITLTDKRIPRVQFSKKQMKQRNSNRTLLPLLHKRHYLPQSLLHLHLLLRLLVQHRHGIRTRNLPNHLRNRKLLQSISKRGHCRSTVRDGEASVFGRDGPCLVSVVPARDLAGFTVDTVDTRAKIEVSCSSGDHSTEQQSSRKRAARLASEKIVKTDNKPRW